MDKIDYLITESYDVGDDFIADIVDNRHENIREVWLYHKECNIKMYIFGFQEDMEWTLEVTQKTIGDHKKAYKKKYMNEEI